MRPNAADRHSLREYQIPEYMHESIVNYVLHGTPTGSFLSAVLANNLTGAVRCADYSNLDCIVQWVRWLRHNAPVDCWGSPEKVGAWILARQAERERNQCQTTGERSQ